MKAVIRRNAPYIAALVIGLLVPVGLAYIDTWGFVTTYLLELLLVISGGTILAMLGLLKDDIHDRSIRTAVEVGIILLMLPVAISSGTLLYDAQDAWADQQTHWHAEYAVIADGTERTILAPERFCDDIACRIGNYTGGSRIHDHGDGYVHVHGPVTEPGEVTLGAFFDTFGGKLAADTMHYRSDSGWVNVTDTDDASLKILLRQGDEDDREWCVLTPAGDDLPQCRDSHTGEPVTVPDDYVISPYYEGPMDQLFFIFDDTSAADALDRVREDGVYNGVSPS